MQTLLPDRDGGKLSSEARICTDCGQPKPLSEFTPNKGQSTPHTRCRPCRAARAKLAYQPSTSPLAQARRERQAEKELGELTCKQCGRAMPLNAFVRIKQSRNAYYGRCEVGAGETGIDQMRTVQVGTRKISPYQFRLA